MKIYQTKLDKCDIINLKKIKQILTKSRHIENKCTNSHLFTCQVAFPKRFIRRISKHDHPMNVNNFSV